MMNDFDGGFKMESVTDVNGKELSTTTNKTMMRIDLPQPLDAKKSTSFSLDWSFNIVEQKVLGGRGGYEYFKDDDNYLYEIAQFFPRLVAYTDATGWQHKQFLGSGELQSLTDGRATLENRQ